MTNHEIIIMLCRTAYQLACGEGKISKAAARRAVRGRHWHDNLNQKSRTDLIVVMAVRMRAIRQRRAAARKLPDEPTLAQRLTFFKKRHFLASVRQANFRVARAGEHITFAYFVDKPEEVHAVYTTTSGNRYSRNRIARRENSEHRFYVHRLWYANVCRPGLAVLNGTLTLYLGQEEPVQGATVRPAVWVSQSHGFGVKTNRGYLASRAGAHYHAATKEQAVRGVLAGRPDPCRTRRARPLRFEVAEQMFGDVAVTAADWQEAGYSPERAAIWCRLVALDPHKPLTFGDVVRGFRTYSPMVVLRLIRLLMKRAAAKPPRSLPRKG